MSDVLRSAGLDCGKGAREQLKADKQRRQRREPTLLLGIGTAVPQHHASQQQACEFMQRVLQASGIAGPREAALLSRLYKNSGIQKRHSVIEDYVREDLQSYTFFPQNEALDPFPSTAARMAKYEEYAVDLAARAAQQAMDAAGIDPADFTHIVISTCTGFFAPGPDVLLLRRLGLPGTTARTVIGFMGCYAGLTGLRTCNDIIKADPTSVVLQIAVELCSLHYQKSAHPDAMVANAIFADGAAAAVWAGGGAEVDGESGALARVLATHSDISADTIEHMSWRIGDHGFIMTLDAGVPDVLRTAAPPFVNALATASRLEVGDIAGWAVHPGGRKIVESIQAALSLSDDDVAASTRILRDYGNMSSATILFVLQEELARREAGEPIAAMGFGPGLTMEGALLVKE